MTAATHTRGTLVQAGDEATATSFVTIAEVKSFDGPSSQAPSIDVSSFDSTGKEFIAGLSDGGEVSLDLNFVGSDSGQEQLLTDHQAGTSRYYQIVFNDHDTNPTTVVFVASVTGHTPSGQTDAAYMLKVTLKVSGTPDWTFAP